MVNREYIKSQIDTLPEEIVLNIGKLINRRINKPNAETIKAIKEAEEILASGNYKTYKTARELHKSILSEDTD